MKTALRVVATIFLIAVCSALLLVLPVALGGQSITTKSYDTTIFNGKIASCLGKLKQ